MMGLGVFDKLRAIHFEPKSTSAPEDRNYSLIVASANEFLAD